MRNTFGQSFKLPSGLDHLIYVCANLKEGMDEIEHLLGIRPVFGGQHPQYGTHNGLLSLGESTYLEIIAHDPTLPLPKRGAFVDIATTARSHLATWAYRTEDIQTAAQSIHDAGIAIGDIEAGKREQSDGSTLKWHLTDPYVMLIEGAIPFLISWGSTTHPASIAPSGGQLVDFWIEHPEPINIQQVLSAFKIDVKVVYGEKYRLNTTIRCKDRLVTLQ